MSYFVRQKTTSVQDSSFKLVHLYAYADNEEPRLCEPEHTVLDIENKNEFSTALGREMFEVIVESNFNAGDFALLFNFPEEIDDKAREKEVLSYLSRMGWVYQGKPVANSNATASSSVSKPAYIYRSECDWDGGLAFTVLLRTDGKLTEDKLMNLCKRDLRDWLSIQRLCRDENGLLVIPNAGKYAQYYDWRCSDNIQSPTVTVEDDTIRFEDLEAFLKAKVGEDTAPIIHKMFGEWRAAHSHFSSKNDETDNPHIEFRLVNQGKSITKDKGSDFERD